MNVCVYIYMCVYIYVCIYIYTKINIVNLNHLEIMIYIFLYKIYILFIIMQ